ncbi:MAG: hypothetical protein CVU35_00415 [Betaproteobacteria bacterium HGW-Betaproteobacteria-8]|nr:MAG: hypothetical protein CVU35_00415 [Betaproteobacteria bacterium HGW-Betaproteobacteria-8]
MFNRIANRLLSPTTSLFFIGLMMSLPFVYPGHGLPIPGFYSEWLAGGLGLLALLPLLKRESWQPLEIPRITLIFPGFIALVFIQWLLGMLHSSQYALMAASYLVWAFFLAILGNHLRRQLGWEQIITTLSWFVLAGGLLNGLIALLQLLTQNVMVVALLSEAHGYGVFAKASYFTSYTALAVISAFYLYSRAHLKAVAAIITATTLILTLSLPGLQGSWAYLLTIALLAILLRSKVINQQAWRAQVEQGQSRRLLRIALIALPLLALAQLAVSFMIEPQPTAAPQTLDESVAVSGFAAYLHLWRESWQLFLQAPWLGIGLGQLRWETFNTFNGGLAQGLPAMFGNTQNLLVQLLVETGIVGVLLLLVGLVAWLRAFAWRHLAFSGWWLLAVLAVIGIHAMFEFSLWFACFLGIAAFLLGAGEEKTSQVRIAFSGRALVVTVLVMGAVHLGSMLIGYQVLQRWLTPVMEGEVADGKFTPEQAMFDQLNWVRSKTLLAPYADILYVRLLVPDETMLQEKLEITQSALHFMPTRAAAYRYPLLLALNGQTNEAILQLRNALAVFPGSFTKQLRDLPFQYWQLYVELLQEAKPKLNILERQPAENATGDQAGK